MISTLIKIMTNLQEWMEKVKKTQTVMTKIQNKKVTTTQKIRTMMTVTMAVTTAATHQQDK